MTTNNNRDRSNVNVTHGIKIPDDNTKLNYVRLFSTNKAHDYKVAPILRVNNKIFYEDETEMSKMIGLLKITIEGLGLIVVVSLKA